MEREQLHAQAMAWEIRHSGRTPRVADSLSPASVPDCLGENGPYNMVWPISFSIFWDRGTP